ncbi:GrpB family protein [Actinomadura sp. 9N215]|uniref:GrpB family protein n=1 Tax=Actinomadura sp. 9N215 TaxID=3375150 RepID=UPI0037A1ACBE
MTADEVARHGLGLSRGQVRVCASDPRWADVFSRLASALRSALGTKAVSVEHVGSTSVPGLSAKPILDVAIALASDAVTEDVIAALGPLGYDFRGDKGDQGGWLFVLEDRPGRRVAHVHVVQDGDPQWNRWLSFRDLLRADARVRADYDRLKRELATRHPRDRRAYTRDKTSFVTSRVTSGGGR